MEGKNFILRCRIWLFTLAMMLCALDIYAGKVEAQYAITVDGVVRKYDLYVPTNVVQNCPVVFSLPMDGNGYGRIDFKSLAEEKGFIVVYPFQNNNTWHPTGDMSDQDFSNDLHFLHKIIDKIKTIRQNDGTPVTVDGEKLKSNTDRVYLVGCESGAEMVFACANYSSDIFAGFAAVCGFPVQNHLRTAGKRPVPFMLVSPDTRVSPYTESLESVVLDQMIARNGCSYNRTLVSESKTENIYSYEPIDNNYTTYPVRFVLQNNVNNLWSSIQLSTLTSTIWNFFDNNGNPYTLPESSAYNNALVWRPDMANVTPSDTSTDDEEGGDEEEEETTCVLTKDANSCYNKTFTFERKASYKVEFETSWTGSDDNNAVCLKMFGTDGTECSNCFYQNDWYSTSTNSLELNSKMESTFVSGVDGNYKLGVYTYSWANIGTDPVTINNVNLYKLVDGVYTLQDAVSNAKQRRISANTGNSHGFTRDDSSILKYGVTTGSGKVYYALQLAAGKYTMKITTNNASLSTDDVTVSLVGTDDNIIDDVTVENGVITCDGINPSEFDEYTLTISKNGDADFSITDIVITGKVTEYDLTIFPDSNVEPEVVKDCDCYSGVDVIDMYYNPYESDSYLYRFYNESAGKLAIHTHITSIGDNNMAVLNLESVAADGVWEAVFTVGTRGESIDAETYHFNKVSTKTYSIDATTTKVVYSIPSSATELTVTLKVKDDCTEAQSNIRVASIQLYKIESASNMTSVLYQFPFSQFAVGDGCEYDKVTRTVSSTNDASSSGWDFGDDPKDLSGYNYLTVTAGQARTDNDNPVVMTITDADGNSLSSVDDQDFELSSSNPNILTVSLKSAKTAGLKIKKIKTLTFNVKSGDSFSIDNVFATTKQPSEVTDYTLSGKNHLKYGTISLPCDAAVSGAYMYNIYSVNETSITISRMNGIMEAGKGYIYRAIEYSSCNPLTSDSKHDVHFYQVTSRSLWTPIYNNGIMGTFTQISKLDYGTYVLSNNKIYEVNSDVKLGANKAYFIFDTKVTAPSTSNGAKIRILGDSDEDDIVTYVDSKNDSDATATVDSYYSLSGTRISGPAKGINIVKMSNGKIKKMIVM